MQRKKIFEAIKATAVTKSYHEVIRLIKEGADITETNDNGMNPIQFAHSFLMWDCITAMVENSKEVNVQGRFGNLFLAAVKNNQYEATSALLKADASKIYCTVTDHNNYLHCAVKNQSKKMLQLLLSYVNDGDKDLSQTNLDNQTPIQLAAELGFWEGVKEIVESKPTDDNDNARYGDVLRVAVIKDKLDIAESILKAFGKCGQPIKNACLHEAVNKDSPKMISLLLRNGADINAVNQDKLTPIESACVQGKWNSALELIQDNAYQAKDSAKAGMAFNAAIKAGKLNIADYLKKAGASFNFRNLSDLNNNLHCTVKNKHIKMLQLLLSYMNDGDKDLSQTNLDNQTPIQLAAELGFWVGVKEIVESKPTDDNDNARYGDVLRVAVIKDKLDIAESILKAFGKCGQPIKNACLHEAVNKGSPKMISLLLRNGADINAVNQDKLTPLESACVQGKWNSALELIQDNAYQAKDSAKAGMAFNAAIKAGKLNIADYLYLKARAPINFHDLSDDKTALHLAVCHDVPNNPKALKYLLENEALQTELNGIQGETPVEMASRMGHFKMVQILVECNDAKGEKKATPEALHYQAALNYALQAGDYAIAKLFLERGTSCNQCDNEKGNIPLYHAICLGRSDLIELLLAFGADPTIKNKAKKSSYDIASDLDQFKCRVILEKRETMQGHTGQKLSSDIATLVEESNFLYQDLILDAITADKIPSTLKKLEKIHHDILENDLNNLKNRYSVLSKSQAPHQSSTAMLTMTMSKFQPELDQLTDLMKVINLLIKYPNKGISNDAYYKIKDTSSVEAGHILTYLERKQKIMAYIEKIRMWMEQCKTDIKHEKWQKKNIRGKWVDGITAHASDILKTLEKVSPSSSAQDVLNIYSQVVSKWLQISSSTRRHQSTKDFYQNKSQDISTINFDTQAFSYQNQPLQLSSAPLEFNPNSSLIDNSVLQTTMAAPAYPHTNYAAYTPMLPSHGIYPVLSNVYSLPSTMLPPPSYIESTQGSLINAVGVTTPSAIYPVIEPSYLAPSEPAPVLLCDPPTFNQPILCQLQPMQQLQQPVTERNVNSQPDNTQVVNTISQTNFDRQMAQCPPIRLFSAVNQNVRQEQKVLASPTPAYD